MKKSGTIAGLIFCCFATLAQHPGQVSSTHHRTTKMVARRSTNIHYGVASFYANKFEGRKMANGQLFHQEKMTAASNTIALGKWVRVTCLRNKRSVVVLITDRMNKTNKRLIDLSHSAAKRLRYTGHGLDRVKVEILLKKPPGEFAAG